MCSLRAAARATATRAAVARAAAERWEEEDLEAAVWAREAAWRIARRREGGGEEREWERRRRNRRRRRYPEGSRLAEFVFGLDVERYAQAHRGGPHGDVPPRKPDRLKKPHVRKVVHAFAAPRSGDARYVIRFT